MCAQPRAFQLRVPDEVLTDLHERLSRIRWPDEPPDSPAWQYGTDLTYLQRLVAYWQDGYDWRTQEALLNAFPQYVVPVGGISTDHSGFGVGALLDAEVIRGRIEAALSGQEVSA